MDVEREDETIAIFVRGSHAKDAREAAAVPELMRAFEELVACRRTLGQLHEKCAALCDGPVSAVLAQIGRADAAIRNVQDALGQSE